MRHDLHCHTTFSDGKRSVRGQIRGAEAMGMDCLGITDHYRGDSRLVQPGGLDEYLAEIERESARSRVTVLKGTEAAVLDLEGRILAPPEVTDRLDWVLAEFSAAARLPDGIFTNQPDSAERFVENVIRATISVCRNPRVHGVAHPFNAGTLTIPLRPSDFPEPRVREVGRVLVQTQTAYNVTNPMCHWFPQMPVAEFHREYVDLLRILVEEGVRFCVGSDDHWTGVGHLTWAVRALNEAGISVEQWVDPTEYVIAHRV